MLTALFHCAFLLWYANLLCAVWSFFPCLLTCFSLLCCMIRFPHSFSHSLFPFLFPLRFLVSVSVLLSFYPSFFLPACFLPAILLSFFPSFLPLRFLRPSLLFRYPLQLSSLVYPTPFYMAFPCVFFLP